MSCGVPCGERPRDDHQSPPGLAQLRHRVARRHGRTDDVGVELSPPVVRRELLRELFLEANTSVVADALFLSHGESLIEDVGDEDHHHTKGETYIIVGPVDVIEDFT